jgi:hypothetical protein
MITKIVGLSFTLLGLSLIIFFPFLDKYQPEPLGKAAIFVGIILLGIGIYLLKS